MLAALACGQTSAYLDEAGMPDVITANRLTDGMVVFQTADDNWTEDFNRAAVLPDPQATAEALKRAKQDEANNIVVDSYAVAVEERNGHLAPKALREAIRAAGPTIRRDLGKQALGQAPHAGPKVATETDHVSL
jgi:sulfite reductase (NADPH) hemoprotein beta-component